MRHFTEQQVESYGRQVDKAFRAIAGMAYSYVRDDLEAARKAPSLVDALNHDLSPGDFAQRVSNRFGLKGPESSDVIPFNRRVAALAEFVGENPDWMMGRDGAVYREGPEGVERIQPGKDPSGKRFGFEASISREGFLEVVDGEIQGIEGEFERLDGALDIGDAVERLESRYSRNLGM